MTITPVSVVPVPVDPAAPIAAPEVERRRARRRMQRALRTSVLWLGVIAAGQAALALRPGLNTTPFEDEALYLVIGHRMIQHLLHGAVLREYPGTYFSGAPGFYPVIGAVGDALGGLEGARLISLAFAVVAMVAVFGIGRELYGRLAGLLGAGAFAACGSVVYQSHFATFDALTLALVATAAWLAVYSAKRDGLLWAPVVGALLAAAFLSKYAGAAYAPVVAALGAAVAWPRHRLTAVGRGAFVLLSGAVMAYVVIELWGTDLITGIRTTTSSRVVLSPASAGALVAQVGRWGGAWLALAALAAAGRLRRGQWRVTGCLLLGAVIGPLEQIRIHESTSLNKHIAFGMIFAAPLAGDLLARAARRLRYLTVPLVGAVMAVLVGLGATYSGQFLTAWVQDSNLVPVLRAEIAASPHKAILGEVPSPERYALGGSVQPAQWNDTFSFFYDGKKDQPAYVRAIQQTHFGVIYLSLTTPLGRFVHDYLTRQQTPYRLDRQVPRYLHGKVVGAWLIYTPKVVAGAS